MKPFTLLLPALSLLFVLGTTGCSSSSVNSIENAEKNAAMTILRDCRVVTDDSLEDRLVPVRLNTATNAAGILRLQIEVENLSRKRISAYAILDWYDGDAIRLDTAGGGWQQYVFEPRESRSLTFTAPTPSAKDFRLKLIEAER